MGLITYFLRGGKKDKNLHRLINATNPDKHHTYLHVGRAYRTSLYNPEGAILLVLNAVSETEVKCKLIHKDYPSEILIYNINGICIDSAYSAKIDSQAVHDLVELDSWCSN